jgi:phosphoenolpyruvate-protein kinase (PTS system EI component)
VKAFMIAADARPLNILIPMVSTIRELRAILKLIREAVDELAGSADGLAGNPGTPPPAAAPRLGAMIEVPAAVELAGSIAREVDFLSIGSNDLIQYTLAADRESARAAEQASPYHPAVLRMIRRTIAAAHKEDRPVSLCGELANHSKLAAALVAMGIDSLSLTPGAIPELKRRLASARILELRKDIDSILELDDAMEIREKLGGYLEG